MLLKELVDIIANHEMIAISTMASTGIIRTTRNKEFPESMLNQRVVEIKTDMFMHDFSYIHIFITDEEIENAKESLRRYM